VARLDDSPRPDGTTQHGGFGGIIQVGVGYGILLGRR
jgi:hypothetical protein